MSALSGCASPATSDDAAARRDDAERPVVRVLPRADDEIYLVNALAQQLLTYSTASDRMTAMTNEPNHFYYGFRTPSDLYTVGHSIENRYEIREITTSGMRTVMALPAGEGLFPLTSDTGGAIFARYTFDANGSETDREIVELDGGDDLVAWKNVDGAVSYAAVVGPWLYFTVWQEGSDDYSLRRVARDDKSAMPETVRASVAGGQLYAHRGELFTSDGTRVSDGARAVECDDLCWFRDDPDVLVRMSVTDPAALRLDVYDGRDFSIIETVRSVVGFTIEPDAVHVYGEGFERRVDVSATS
jgi:hypothetical protein